MRVSLTYAQVETALAGMNRIADDKRIAFKARLKHLQRLGFPPGSNTGTGKRVAYSYMTYIQMVVAVELMQSGIAPARIVRIIEGNWGNMEPDVLFALTPESLWDRFSPPVTSERAQFAWVLSLEALRDLSEEGEGEYDYHEAIDTVPISQLSAKLGDEDSEGPMVGELWRTLVLQGRLLIHIATHFLLRVDASIKLEDIYADVEDHLVAKGKRLKELFEWFDRTEGKWDKAAKTFIKPEPTDDSDPQA